jgi:hypothetical protein
VSYLERPRFTFSGRFEADVSTVNNNPVNFDDATFLPEYDTPGAPVLDSQGNDTGRMTNGWWNPTGTATFRLVNCRVTSAQLKSGDCRPSDPILKMKIGDAADRAPGKIVDLDPMQQMVSTIFGLQMRLIGTEGDENIFTGHFAPAPFTDIWFTRGGGPGSVYQSILTGNNGGPPAWSRSLADSPFLQEFRELAEDRPFSVRFLVDALSQKAMIHFSQLAESSAQLELRILPSRDISYEDAISSFRSILAIQSSRHTERPSAVTSTTPLH